MIHLFEVIVPAFCTDSCPSQRAFFQAVDVPVDELSDERCLLQVTFYIVRYLFQNSAFRAEEHPVEPDDDNVISFLYGEHARGVVRDDKRDTFARGVLKKGFEAVFIQMKWQKCLVHEISIIHLFF